MTTQTAAPDSNAVQQSDRASVTTDDILGMINTWMRERKLAQPSDLNTTFSEAGFDSLDSVELSFFLQDQFGVEIDETVLYNYPTFAALVDYVKARL
ncbi:MAG: acyl carrier protein [Paraburkholderia tropica]|uniref:acyl carrier protein n=1 Tax=Burkholderia gladioli TaxID=28095 RepID=UPI00068DEE47|nr:acyl carrier protein [Burkholderia gladioli]AYQ91803.1 phosphopantetheine-binding protein [Burkholderia gladioli]